MSPASGGIGYPTSSLRAYDAQYLIEQVALRIAPALTAAIIFAHHSGEWGVGLLAFAAMISVSYASTRVDLPLPLLPGARLALAGASAVTGAVLLAAICALASASPSLGDLGSGVGAAWVVLAIGAWITYRVEEAAPVDVAVVGDAEFAADLALELEAGGIHGYRVVGWIGGEVAAPDRTLARLGSLREVRSIVMGRGVELLVCAPGDDLADSEEHAVFGAIADYCLDLPVRMIAASQFYESLLGHTPIGTIDSAWFRYIMHPSFRVTPPLSKRAFDLAGAVLIALVFAPMIVIAVLAMKIFDPGPIIYRQRRVGENGREFEILKLRTMRVDAEPDGRAVWSEADDERVTSIGRWLRRSHLDELPQLWNIVRGEMTLVGPRPERPEIVAEIETRFPHYTRRHLVKPGIAGWAQVRCGYAGSDLGTAWKLCHDLYYVKHRSIIGDALILLETALVTFRDAHRSLRAPDERFILGHQTHG